MSTTNTDLLHGDKDPLDFKQPSLPNNELPNAGFWNAPKPDAKPAPYTDPSNGAVKSSRTLRSSARGSARPPRGRAVVSCYPRARHCTRPRTRQFTLTG